MRYEVGTKVLGNWEIVKELGHGAFGYVYEIERTSAGVTAHSALKVIRVPASEKDVRAAMNEGMTQASVQSYFQRYVDEIVKEISMLVSLKGHPNIVYYEDHDVLQDETGIGWDILIRMELLTSLMDYQFAHGSLSRDQVIQMGIEITEALSYCEEKQLVHRDISPDNIFVTKQGHFKLGDFGVARTLEKTTGGLSRKGKESYMAPEVYMGGAYGKTVDIYSLGLVLYRLLNQNRAPFLPTDTETISFEEREQALVSRMGGKELPLPAQATSELGRVICKACAYRPEDRYQSAGEFRQALRDVSVKDVSGTQKIEEKDANLEPAFEYTWGDKPTTFETVPEREKTIDYPPKRDLGKLEKMLLVLDAFLGVVAVGMITYCLVNWPGFTRITMAVLLLSVLAVGLAGYLLFEVLRRR